MTYWYSGDPYTIATATFIGVAEGAIETPETVFVPKRNENGKLVDSTGQDKEAWEEVEFDPKLIDYGKLLTASGTAERKEMTADAWTALADPHATVNVAKFEKQVLSVVEDMIDCNPTIGAIVLECTDLPPFSAAIRKLSGLPVFDIVTLADMIFEAIAGNRWSLFQMNESP